MIIEVAPAKVEEEVVHRVAPRRRRLDVVVDRDAAEIRLDGRGAVVGVRLPGGDVRRQRADALGQLVGQPEVRPRPAGIVVPRGPQVLDRGHANAPLDAVHRARRDAPPFWSPQAQHVTAVGTYLRDGVAVDPHGLPERQQRRLAAFDRDRDLAPFAALLRARDDGLASAYGPRVDFRELPALGRVLGVRPRPQVRRRRQEVDALELRHIDGRKLDAALEREDVIEAVRGKRPSGVDPQKHAAVRREAVHDGLRGPVPEGGERAGFACQGKRPRRPQQNQRGPERAAQRL